MNLDRVEYYRGRLGEGESFPRAVALYLNGAVALLLDGHHKAAACAMEGAPVRTLVIFRTDGDEAALAAAAESGRRLYLCLNHGDYRVRRWEDARGLVVCDGDFNLLSGVSCLQTMEQRRIRPRKVEPPEWGTVPPELYTENFRKYPSVYQVCMATWVPPDLVRAVLEAERRTPVGKRSRQVITSLLAYAKFFPDSKWLTPADIEWLRDAENGLDGWF